MENKIIIIYQSGKGNTKFIANEIAKKLNCDAIDVVTNPAINLEKYNIVGFGSGIYFGSFGGKLKKWIKNIKWSNEEVNKPDAFIFSVQGGSNPARVHTHFKKFLEKNKKIITLSGWATNAKESHSAEAIENLHQWIDSKIVKTNNATDFITKN